MNANEFPRLVYRALKDSKSFEHTQVHDMEAYDEKLADGWHGSVPEALAAGAGDSAGGGDNNPGGGEGGGKGGGGGALPETREALEALARKLGLSFQPNIGDKKLRQRVEIALATGGES